MLVGGYIWPLDSASQLDLWLVIGVLCAGIIRSGVPIWPGVLASFLGCLFLSPAPARLHVTITFLSTIVSSAAAAYFLKATQNVNLALDRQRDLQLFSLFGILGITFLGGTLDLALRFGVDALSGRGDIKSTDFNIYISYVGGVSIVAIALLSWAMTSIENMMQHWWRSVLSVVLMVVLLILSNVLFQLPDQSMWSHLGLIFPLIGVVLIAFLGGMPLASLTTLLLTFIAIEACLNPNSIFNAHPRGSTHQPAFLWVYLCCLTVSSLGFSFLVSELKLRMERWNKALTGSSIGVGDWHLSSGRLIMSDQLKRMLGYEPHELKDEYSEWQVRLHPEDVPSMEASLRNYLKGNTSYFKLEHRMRCKDGSWKWFEINGRAVSRSPRGKVLRIVGFTIDVTDRHVTADRLRLAANLFEFLHQGLIITDEHFVIVDVNPAFEQLSGMSRSHWIGKVPPLVDHEQQTKEFLAEVFADLAKHETWRGVLTTYRLDGTAYPQQVTLSVVKNEIGRVTHHVLIVTDVTEEQLVQQRLEFQAYCDPLTQLPNRLRLQQLMRRAIAAIDRQETGNPGSLAICYLDMDHFKPINDTFGHGIGDMVLIELCRRMRSILRSGDAAARLGGDEFALLLHVNDKEECVLALERLLKILTEPYQLNEHGSWTLTASIGVTLYPQDSTTPDTLLRHADHAMYGAKQAGRNRIQFFDPENDRQSTQRRDAAKRLKFAIDAGELVLHYQPKLNLKTGQPIGVEALIRWQHPQRGLLMPSEFLALVDTTELAVHLGEWVLSNAMAQLASWKQLGIPLTVSVNISGQHLQQSNFASRLKMLLDYAGLESAQGLELEVLETAAFEDVSLTATMMMECRALGARFALDDFGTGYSTLTYLKRLPVDVLKIDRSFVDSMLEDPHDLAIVRGVIGLSKTFNCTVVAEGVESEALSTMLISLGCDLGQGYGLASPMPSDVLKKWLTEKSQDSSSTIT